MIYVALGMHKSSTSLIAEVLHTSGISMLEDSSAGARAGSYEANKHERVSFQRINIEVIGKKSSLRLPGLSGISIDQPQRQRMTAAIREC